MYISNREISIEIGRNRDPETSEIRWNTWFAYLFSLYVGKVIRNESVEFLFPQELRNTRIESRIVTSRIAKQHFQESSRDEFYTIMIFIQEKIVKQIMQMSK